MARVERVFTAAELSPAARQAEVRRCQEALRAQRQAQKPTCLNCQFNIYNGAYTECRRFPPPWVRVADTDWCGEHKRRPGGLGYRRVEDMGKA